MRPPRFYLAILAASLTASASDYRLGQRLNPAAKTQVSTYRDLHWDHLVPKHWNPMAAFKGMNLDQLKDNDPRAQELLDKMRAAWNSAPTEPALNGAAVRLAGFVIPLERQGERVAEVLLVPYFGACIHMPPPANQTIHVILRTPMRDIRMMDAFWVSGTLNIARGDSGMGVYGYRLHADSLQRYTFNKR